MHISAEKRKLYLVFFFHDRLYFRYLYPVSFPHEEGVCERFFIKLTMPQEGRGPPHASHTSPRARPHVVCPGHVGQRSL